MAPTTPATAEPAKPNKRGRPSITAIAVRDGQQRTIGASIAMAANRLAAAESFAPAVATSNNGPLPEHSCCSSCDTPPHAGAHGGGSSASHAQNEDGSQQSPQREPFAAGQQQAGDEATRRASLLAVLSVGLMGRAVASASQRHLARQPGAPPAPAHEPGEAPCSGSSAVRKRCTLQPTAVSSTKLGDSLPTTPLNDVDFYEATIMGKLWRARMERPTLGCTPGTTVDGFNPKFQWEALTRWCGGAESLDRHIHGLLETCSATEGGISANGVQLGFDSSGTLGLLCVLCNGPRAMGVANSGRTGSAPFINFCSRHVGKPGHENARSLLREQAALCESDTPLVRATLLYKRLLARGVKQVDLPAQETEQSPAAALRPIGTEPSGRSRLGGSVLTSVPPPAPLTRQQQLDEKCGSGRFTALPGAGSFMCSRCSRHFDLTHTAFLWNAHQHANMDSPCSSTAFRQQTLEYYGVAPGAAPMLSAVQPAAVFDYSTLCHGYWPRTVVQQGRVLPVDNLLGEWRDGKTWHGMTVT